MGLCARIAVTSTLTRQRLFLDKRYGIHIRQAFEMAARIRDHFKEEDWMGDGQSHVFLDEIAVNELRDRGDTDPPMLPKIRCIAQDPVAFRGAGLPRIRMYAYEP